MLYVLLVLYKRYKGKFKIYIGQKNQITCNTIDKWLGDGVCICKNGIMRLHKMDVITVEAVKRKYYDVEVHIPDFETQEKAFTVDQRNPLISFYKNNGERKVEKCVICGRDFIKTGNTITCSENCSRENRKRNNRKNSA